MSAKHRGNQDRSQIGSHPVSSLTPASVGLSRAALLAGASLVVFAALSAPGAMGAAHAACASSPQTISGPVAGPILSDGGAITVTGSGKISGDSDGIDAVNCAITKLAIKPGGIISAGAGGSGLSGGVGVSNANKITTLISSGTIGGGNGGADRSAAD